MELEGGELLQHIRDGSTGKGMDLSLSHSVVLPLIDSLCEVPLPLRQHFLGLLRTPIVLVQIGFGLVTMLKN